MKDAVQSRQAGDALNEELRESERNLRWSQALLAGQNEAFQAAMDDATLETSLGILVRTAVENGESERRCAFYIVQDDGTLRHLVGMPKSYARHVDGFKSFPEFLACGLAVARGEPVITPDVEKEPRWAPWLWLARDFGYRGCWSFPLETRSGKLLGLFAMYFREPREPTPVDRELAQALSQTAAIIISRRQEAQERVRAEAALRESEAGLRVTLDATQRLQNLSSLLIHEGNVDALNRQIVRAAREIMHSDAASMQVFERERDALRLIATEGFHPEAEAFWEWVRRDSASTCGFAMASGQRVVTPDVETNGAMAGTEDLRYYRTWGMRAVQSTPLVSRSGAFLGMISTHWREPHEPSERDLRLFDVLARQAADLVERVQTETQLRQSEERFRAMSDNIAQLAWTCDRLGDATWYNQRWLDYTGLTFEEMRDWGWKQVQHPDHVDRVVAGVTRSRETGEIWEDTFPLRGKDGNYRWFLSRAAPVRDAAGNIVRWFGTNTDITELREAEVRQRFLVNELNHRVKNMLATVQAIAAQTFRADGVNQDMRESFEARLMALSKAHDILARESWKEADVHDILAQSLAPHAGPERLHIEGPRIRLSPKAALAIAMGIHELATNAEKYGALSNGTGRIDVTWTIDDPKPGALKLRWSETGGPAVSVPKHKGFGSRLIERSLSRDLDGEARIDFRPEGVVCTIVARLE